MLYPEYSFRRVKSATSYKWFSFSSLPDVMAIFKERFDNTLWIKGSNMIFHSLTFPRSRVRCWKPRAKSWMNDKIMFDCYYCINSKETTENWENVCALYSSALPLFSYACTLFINILDSGHGQVLFLIMIWQLRRCFAWRPGECINIIQ